MKKLIIFVMSLALVAAVAFANDLKVLDNTGEPNIPEGYDRTAQYPCSPDQTPVENPNLNNTCSNPDPTVLGCEDRIFAWASINSHDFYKICIPAENQFVVRLRDCNGNLIPEGVKMIAIKLNHCSQYLSDWSQTDIELVNENDAELCYIIKVVRYENTDRCYDISYRLDVVCTPINTPCVSGEIDYCADPIVVPSGAYNSGTGIYSFDDIHNCNGATDVANVIPTGGCGSTQLWPSGLDLVYLMELTQDLTYFHAEVSGPGNPDVQIMIVTDCSDPYNTCVASRDLSFTDPEVIEQSLTAGTYYIITSIAEYGSCGDIHLYLEGDHPLPVELTGFDAVAGDGEITLNWSTASETSSKYFDVLRDGAVMGRVEAANSVTGHAYSWTDLNLINGREYTYNLVAEDINGTRETVGTVSATPAMNAAAVTEYALLQNYPNPFNPETNIVFDLVEASDVTLTVYNPLGQTIATLVNGAMESGRHTVTFDGSSYTSGLYYYRLEAGDFTAVRKMILMK
jgi:hypothetical protein